MASELTERRSAALKAAVGLAGATVTLALVGAPAGLTGLLGGLAATLAALAAPGIVLVLLILLTGLIGTISALTGAPVNLWISVLVVALWIAAGVQFSAGRRPARYLWPGLILAVAFLGLSAVQVFTAERLTLGFESFRLSGLYLSVLVLIALAPWRRGAISVALRGFAAVALGVGVYSVLRYVTGPTDAEYELAREVLPGLLSTEEPRFFGSLLSSHQLGSWAATSLPLLCGLTLAWTDRWRWVAATGAGLMVFSILAADSRAAAIAGLIGAVVVLAGFALLGRGRGDRAALRATSALAAGLLAAAGFSFATTVATDPLSSERFSRLADPVGDPNVEARFERWDEARELIGQQPLGYGLGTTGFVGITEREAGPVGNPNLDSSYLKVALEQGIAGLALLVAALVGLIGGLVAAARRAPDLATSAVLTGSAASTLTLAALFGAGLYIEGVTALAAAAAIGLGCALVTRDPQLAGTSRRLPLSSPSWDVSPTSDRRPG